jgi:hypothetical protein
MVVVKISQCAAGLGFSFEAAGSVPRECRCVHPDRCQDGGRIERRSGACEVVRGERVGLGSVVFRVWLARETGRGTGTRRGRRVRGDEDARGRDGEGTRQQGKSSQIPRSRVSWFSGSFDSFCKTLEQRRNADVL